MKTIFTLLIFALAAPISVFAYHDNSVVHIETLYGPGIIVEVDGYEVNHHPQRTVSLFAVAPGYRFLRVIQERRGHHGHGHNTVLFSGHVHIHPRVEVFAEVNRSCGFMVIEEFPLCQTHGHGCRNQACFKPVETRYHGRYERYPRGHNRRYDGYGHRGGGHDNGYGHRRRGRPVHQLGMDEQSFRLLLSEIERASFESSRMTVAQQAIRGTSLSTSQAAEVARKFNFDSSRLDFLKQAYTNIADPERYMEVKSVFTFDSNAQDLAAFVASRQTQQT